MGNTQSETESQQEITDNSLSSACRLYDLAKLEPNQWPILYSPVYNISFWGLQNIHPFDSGKWGKVFQHLIDAKMIKDTSSIMTPPEATESELRVVHTEEYIKSLTHSSTVAMVVEVPPVAILPNSIVQHRLLRPFRCATAGTIMAGKLAKERGWAINIGGGFHHCCSNDGGGFCAYADITLSITFMFKHLSGISKVMIVDLDAHQGNGHERDFLNNEKVYILDMYNRWIYPNDREAKAAIDARVELDPHTRDDEYLDYLSRRLPNALDDFDPDMVVYNAGTDVLIGDPLGQLDITPEGVKERDLKVFKEVRQRAIPIFMVTSGGYQRNNAQVIADSILNLKKNELIFSPEDDPHIGSELRAQGATLGPTSVDTSQPLEQSTGSVGMDLTSSQNS